MSGSTSDFVSAAPLKYPDRKRPTFPRSTLAANAAHRESIAARRASLRVPPPFHAADDFLAAARRLVESLPAGANRQIADICGVSTSTASKWLRGVKVPMQPNLDKVIEWWKAHRDAKPVTPQTPTTPRVAAKVSLARLPSHISARLKRAARLRNVDPWTYAAQILDRHLPALEDMQ